MFVQVLLAEHLAGLHSLQLDLVVLTALALFRICDRYLPELQA
jgi:hypothetical protein